MSEKVLRPRAGSRTTGLVIAAALVAAAMTCPLWLERGSALVLAVVLLLLFAALLLRTSSAYLVLTPDALVVRGAFRRRTVPRDRILEIGDSRFRWLWLLSLGFGGVYDLPVVRWVDGRDRLRRTPLNQLAEMQYESPADERHRERCLSQLRDWAKGNGELRRRFPQYLQD